jgi:hypothetical protein
MADFLDDDLLGGPSPASPQKAPGGDIDPLADMDDLLGGPTEANFLDDDLLFGGGGGGTGGAQTAAQAEPPKPKQLAAPQVTTPLTIPKVTAALLSPQLQPFLRDDTYFLRSVLIVTADGARTKRVLSITPRVILTLDAADPNKIVREVDLQRLFGVVLQRKPSRGMGSKDMDMHYLLQIDGESDVWFVLPCGEQANVVPGGKTAVSCEEVLVGIIASWGLNLPVAGLKDVGEELIDLARWGPSPDVRVRHALTETLSYRADVFAEVDHLKKESQKMEMRTLQLKSSSEGQTAGNLTKDIATMEEAISGFKEKLAKLEAKKAEALAARQKAQDDVAAEEKRRETAIKEKVRGEEQEQLLRRAKEVELLKAAHKREMDKISFLTSLYEEHSRNRTQDTYSGVQATIRIEELEQEHASIEGHLARQQDQYQCIMSALKEVKSRIALARDVSERLDSELKILKETAMDAEVPDSLANLDLPDITTVSLEEELAKGGHSTSRVAAQSPPPKAGKAAPAAPPSPPQQPAAKKAPIVLDDDDDI